jgi:hypothetical protein
MRPPVLRLLCLTAALTVLPGVSDAGESTRAERPGPPLLPSAPLIRFQEDRLTVNVTDVPLDELLRELGRQGGFAVVNHGPSRRGVTVRFHELPLDQALRRILVHENFLLDYSRPDSADDPALPAQAAKLWVLAGEDGDHGRGDSPTDSEAPLIGGDGFLGGRGQDDDPDHPAVNATGDMSSPQAGLAGGSSYAGYSPEDTLLDGAVRQAGLSSESSWERERAVEALGEHGHADGAPALGQALADPDIDVRRAALGALVAIGGHEAAQTLGTALQHEDSGFREEVVEALGMVGSETAVPLLQQALNDENPSVRETAAALLEVFGAW